MSDQEPRRFYGIDTTEEWATLVEATVDEDGNVVIESVVQTEQSCPDVTAWLEDEWDDHYDTFPVRYLLGIDQTEWDGLPSPDETGGMTLDELLGRIDDVTGDTDG